MRQITLITSLFVLAFSSAQVDPETSQSNVPIKEKREKKILELDFRVVPDLTSDASFNFTGIRYTPIQKKLNGGQLGKIKLGVGYAYANLEFKEPFIEEFDMLADLHRVGIIFDHVARVGKKWSTFTRINPRLNSNFKGTLSSDDLNMKAVLLFNYMNSSRSRLSLGMSYSNTRGTTAPFPIINYWKKMGNKMEMVVGLPRIGIQYNLDDKSSLRLFAELQGFNANISTDFYNTRFGQGKKASRIGYRDLITGCEYMRKIKSIELTGSIGYTLDRRLEIRDSEREAIYEFNMENSVYINVVTSFNLAKNQRNRKNIE